MGRPHQGRDLIQAGGFLVARETIRPEALEMLNTELDAALPA